MKDLYSKIVAKIDEQNASVISKSLRGYLKPGETVLDYGCGTGRVASRLVGEYKVDVTGVDVVDTCGSRIPFKLISIKDTVLPFEDNAYDYTLISYVLHHTSSAEKILNEVKRVTRRKIFLFEDTPENSLQRVICSMHGHSFRLLLGLRDKPVFRNVAKWEVLFAKLGLQIEKKVNIEKCNPIYNPARTLFVLKV